ncbi:hypothetical protein P3T73_13435 [Kiritimatiellota bacterium B12222]|nr:hypothetical protein P3T73_13435 [Kiritimatiellota bacterium B12222]
MKHFTLWGVWAFCAWATCLCAQELPGETSPGTGPYSLPLDDPDNSYDAPIPGFVGPDGNGNASLNDGYGSVSNPNNYLNPLFFDWADTVVDYSPFNYDAMYDYSPDFVNPQNTLGPVTGDVFDVASLGDMTQQEINDWNADPENAPGPGSLTISFSTPIQNRSGADFTIFENGFVSNYTTPSGTVAGEFWAELAYVEVSQNGVDFYRFDSVSTTDSAVGPYGTLDQTQVYNLAGKHANAYGDSWGTPFDLSDIGLDAIQYIRVVDIPGSGSFQDASGDAIYDGWYTWGSGGADIEAFGAISTDMTYENWPQLQALDPEERGPEDDPDGDGIPNLIEYAFATLPWEADAEQARLNLNLDSNGSEIIPVLSFVRDERLVDITYELQTTTDLTPPISWHPIATARNGAPLQAESSRDLEISESSHSEIASIGVFRDVEIRDVDAASSSPHFYRVHISFTP